MRTFVKRNNSLHPGPLICESKGLALIADHFGVTHGLRTPEVVSVSEDKLTLEFIDSYNQTPLFFKHLGTELANLHRCHSGHFGLSYDNFIGLGPQINGEYSDWGQFFVELRLMKQIEWIADGNIRDEISSLFSKKRDFVHGLLNAHNPVPSLVHGDLWCGNIICGERESPWVIDPAVYYGDREVDIAMSRLFGGFDHSFYRAYMESYPLHEGYDKRESIYNLYHLLNHYNLFGGGYLQQVMAIIRGL